MGASFSEQVVSTPLFAGNAPYVEALYEQYLRDPNSVEPHWRAYFAKLRDRDTRVHVHTEIVA